MIEAIVACSHAWHFASRETLRHSAETRETLKAARPKKLEAVLIAIRLDDEQRYWQEFLPVLTAWGEHILPELDKLAHDKNAVVRRSVALSFREMRLTTLPEALPVLAKDEDAAVRGTAGMALAQMCGSGPFGGRSDRTASPEVVKEVVPLLLGMLDHDEVHDVAPLTFTLGSLAPDHPEIVPALLKILKKSNDRYRRDLLVSAIGSRRRADPQGRGSGVDRSHILRPGRKRFRERGADASGRISRGNRSPRRVGLACLAKGDQR